MTYRFNPLRIAVLGLTLILLGAPAFAAASPVADTPVSETATANDGARQVSVERSVDRVHGYAQREAAAPRAADFKGNGAGIYIGGSTLAVVLVVVLIVVLL